MGIRTVLSESYEDFTYVDAASGGGCTCQGKLSQSGGMEAIYDDIHMTGLYTLAGGTLILGAVSTYSSCAMNASKLTMLPKPALGAMPTTGSIVFGKAAN